MTEKKTKTIRFDGNVEVTQKLNPLFSKAKINVLYTGINRNNTYFNKESVEKAIPTLYNIPIIGEYLKEKDNFGGHGGKVVLSDNNIEFIQTTQPYGVIPESANIYWQDITEDDGTVHNYLTIDGAYLWMGRYTDELDDLLQRSYGQSMEVEVNDGDFETVSGIKDIYNIKDFTFSALCILGVDKGNDDGVEPCFESANISAYALNKNDFKKQFQQMLDELHYVLRQDSLQKGGLQDLADKDPKFATTSTTTKAPQQTTSTTTKAPTNNSAATTSTTTKAPQQTTSTTTAKPKTNNSELITSLKAQLLDTKQALKAEQDRYTALEAKVSELEKFKTDKLAAERKVAEASLFDAFSSELSEDVLNKIKENASKYSVDELENQLYLAVGKAKAKLNKKINNSKVQFEKVSVPPVIDNDNNSDPYGGFVERYGK